MKLIISVLFSFLIMAQLCLASSIRTLVLPETGLLVRATLIDGIVNVELLDIQSLEESELSLESTEDSSDLSCNENKCLLENADNVLDITLFFVPTENEIHLQTLKEGGDIEDFTIKLSGQPQVEFIPEEITLSREETCKLVTIKNTGTGIFNISEASLDFTGPPFRINLYQCEGKLENLAPDESCQFQVCFYPISNQNYQGSLSVTINGVTETLLIHGQGYIPLPPPSPGQADLTIEIVSAPSGILNGKPYPITVKISNIGDKNSGRFKIGFRAYPANNPLQVFDVELFEDGVDNDSLEVENLKAGETASRTYNLLFQHLPTHSYYTLEAIVDIENRVPEKNENNNIAAKTLTVLR